MTRPAPAAPVSVRDAVRTLARALETRGIDEALPLAEWAVADLIGTSRAELRTEGARVLDGPAQARLAERAKRLAADEPLQYVLGHADFLGRRFACDARALIPRPETEELVLAALHLALPDPDAPVRVADIGAGSGCIAISLALERPNAAILATDISADALALAESNARALGAAARIRFLRASLLGDAALGSLDAIVSNPPYIESPALAGLDRRVRDFEPRAALDGGPDGLEVIRHLAPASFKGLRPGGHLLLEIGETQGPAVHSILSRAGFTDVRILPDLCRRDRFAVGIRTPTNPPRLPGTSRPTTTNVVSLLQNPCPERPRRSVALQESQRPACLETGGTRSACHAGASSRRRVASAGVLQEPRGTIKPVKASFCRRMSRWSAADRSAAVFALLLACASASCATAGVVVSEIMYDPVGGGTNEFVELANTGTHSVSLVGWYFADGIAYTFAAGTTIPAGGYLVVAANRAAFQMRYPAVTNLAPGVYNGQLNNGGERLSLADASSNLVFDVTYNNSAPWPAAAAGLGSSLVLDDPAGPAGDPANWRASANLHGSPGGPGGFFVRDVVINEVLAHTDPPQEDAVELANLTTNAVDIGGWYLSDDNAVRKKYRFLAGTVIAPGGYLVVYQNQMLGSNSLAPFSISSKGDDVFLSEADGADTIVRYVDQTAFEPTKNGVAVGRHPDGSGGMAFGPRTTRLWGRGRVDRDRRCDQSDHGRLLPPCGGGQQRRVDLGVEPPAAGR